MMPTRKNYNQNWLPSIFNDFFDNDWMVRANTTAPAINVIESETAYKVELAAPGMTKEDFHVQLSDDNTLTISMEKKSENEHKNEDKKYLRREFSYSQFQQSMIIPDDVEKEKINASVNDGVLTIDLPKKTVKEQAQTCKIIEVK